MLSLTTQIKNKEGLRSRAAATFVQLTNKFVCEIYLNYADKTVDAKSIMGILSLGLLGGSEIIVTFDGGDESQARVSVKNLIENELVNL